MRYVALLALGLALPAAAQSTGSIEGTAVLRGGTPVHNADIIILRHNLRTESDETGKFAFTGLAPGRYDLVAHLHGMTDSTRAVDVKAGEVTRVEFTLSLSAVREQITVSASGQAETNLESFLTVTSASQLDLAARSGSTSLGDLLDGQAGVHKRSFGPGTTRPVVRGFDGDRVLVLEDGVRTGSLSSQSGDHGEPVDPTLVERVEVVRGPATLLYGSNAIGGVINSISPEHELHEKPHQGLSGNLGATGGSANGQGGGSGNLRYGLGNWQLWGGGGSMRTGDYHAPTGRIDDSATNLKNVRFGLGRFSEHGSASFGYSLQDGRYGVPFTSEISGEDGDIELAYRRNQFRFTGALRGLGPALEQFTVKLNYTDWNHRELEGGRTGTEFFNKQFVYRGEFQQRKRRRLSGSFGFWGLARDYKAEGAEALTPPVNQNAFAVFAVEQFNFERVRLQFGGRLERNVYDPVGLRRRVFNGASGGAGLNVPLRADTSFVANYTHSYRAPGLEELYNNGPHVGNAAFEVGSEDLAPERSNGLDLSLRHTAPRLRAEANLFVYGISNFVYGAPLGEFEDGLPVLAYRQRDARFTGTELKASAALRSGLWLNLALDTVRARLTADDTPLPRIPPVRGRVGFDIQHKDFSLRPELVLTNRQDSVFPTETPTAGYVLPNLTASYSISRQHALHVVSVNFFNLGNTLYRNHLSLIKQFAPEIGRGLRVSYNVHFY